MIRKKRFDYEINCNDKQEIVPRSRFSLPGVSVPFFTIFPTTEVIMGSMVMMTITRSERNWDAVGIILNYRWNTVVAPRF
jgi:hypothetical protein